MTPETFAATLDFILDIERDAHELGYRAVLLSGGEPTENPDAPAFIQMVYDAGLMPILITNGTWLYDETVAARILAFPYLMIQVTNDPRFYPSPTRRVDDPRIHYVDSLTHMFPMGRFSGKGHPELPTKSAPTSFNFRSLVHKFGDVRAALAQHRLRVMMGAPSGHCTPSITHDGTLVAGESRFCHAVGTVHDTAETITANVLAMGSCNRCGLERNLGPAYRAAIGID